MNWTHSSDDDGLISVPWCPITFNQFYIFIIQISGSVNTWELLVYGVRHRLAGRELCVGLLSPESQSVGCLKGGLSITVRRGYGPTGSDDP